MKPDKQEGPRSGAFLLASVLHFYSGQPLQNLSGVDTLNEMPFSTSIWP
jgi:hypothetical protein